MKKNLPLSFLFIILCLTSHLFAQRYQTEIFSTVSVTHNVMFGRNYSVIPTSDDGTGFHPVPGVTLYNDTLYADVYQPAGDAFMARATVIMIHTGSFLPIFYNGQPTGDKSDSAIAEMCRRFARRGYTAIAMDYRAGWDPLAVTQEIRKGTLLQAAGKGMQDAKACIRYFRNNANTVNTYHIDPNEIILGGMGTGGYIALGVATIRGTADISIPGKLTASSTDPSHGFTIGVSYFDSSLWGNIDGYGGALNVSTNTPGVSNSVAFVFNMGGALADSSWLRSADVPMVCFHVPNDPFAPYADGTVIVPTTGDPVIDVSGSYTVIRRADSLNNNISFQNNTWTDPFTLRANQVNQGYDGLFPFVLPDPGPPLHGQAGPWEWADSATVYTICIGGLGFTMGATDSTWHSIYATNPNMSRAKGMAYIDTVFGYLTPRIAAQLAGINGPSANETAMLLYPNPASGYFTVESGGNTVLRSVRMYDLFGRLVNVFEKVNSRQLTIDSRLMEAGIYLVKIETDKGEVVRKISLQ